MRNQTGTMPVNYGNESVLLPEIVDGRELRQLLNMRPNQVPVRVTKDGDYIPIAEHDEYHIQDGDTLTRVNRIING